MDELMLDWLYDELDPPRSARVAEHMGTCARCAAEIGALRRTREAFRDLTDVEPPASLSAILLHEAARRAPQTSSAAPVAAPARTGWWARLLGRLRPVVLHPAAAAVAMLLLVAGVAGTLYVRHGDMAGMERKAEQSPSASPAASPAAPVPADSPAPPPPPPEAVDSAQGADTRFAQPPEEEKAATAGDKAAADPAPRDTGGVGAGLLDRERQAELRQAQAGEHNRFETESKKIQARVRMEASPKAAKPDDGKRGDFSRRGVDPALAEPNAVSSAGPLAKEQEADDDATGAVDRRAGAEAGAGGAPAPGRASTTPGAAPPAQTTTAAEQSAGRYRPYRDPNLSRSEQGWLSTQEDKLDDAVRGRRCREAAAIANDMLDRNAEYYTRRVKDSQAVQPCQWYVSAEQSRRSRLRAQKSTANKARRKGGSANQKVKAAPERDAADAAEKTAQ